MNKLPAKTIQYGMTEYDLPYNIFLINKKTNKELNMESLSRYMKRKCQKHLYEIINNKQLLELLKGRTKYFERFIHKNRKQIMETKLFKIYLEFYKINNGFLEYIIQKELEIKPLFEEKTTKQECNYYIPNFNEIFKYKIIKRGIEKKRIIKDGTYNKILVTDKNNINKKITITVKNGILYTTNKKLLQYKNPLTQKQNQQNGVWAYTKNTYNINYYNKFVLLLKKYFEKVNPSNNTWEETINSQVDKMLNYLKTNPLEQLQQEYLNIKKQKIKEKKKCINITEAKNGKNNNKHNKTKRQKTS